MHSLFVSKLAARDTVVARLVDINCAEQVDILWESLKCVDVQCRTNVVNQFVLYSQMLMKRHVHSGSFDYLRDMKRIYLMQFRFIQNLLNASMTDCNLRVGLVKKLFRYCKKKRLILRMWQMDSVIQRGNVEAARRLLQHPGVDPNLQYSFSHTSPLINAIASGQPAILLALLEHNKIDSVQRFFFLVRGICVEKMSNQTSIIRFNERWLRSYRPDVFSKLVPVEKTPSWAKAYTHVTLETSIRIRLHMESIVAEGLASELNAATVFQPVNPAKPLWVEILSKANLSGQQIPLQIFQLDNLELLCKLRLLCVNLRKRSALQLVYRGLGGHHFDRFIHFSRTDGDSHRAAVQESVGTPALSSM